METGRMVVVNRVAEFVDDHIVAQVLRKSHQKEAQRDVVAPRTTPPLRARGADRKFFVLQARRLATAARCGPAGRLSPHGAAPRCGLSAPRAATAEAGMPACGRSVRAPPRSIPLFAPENPKPVFAAPRRGTKAARRPWRAPKWKCGGRARSARGSPRPAGDAHRGRSSHQHSIDRHSLYYNGRIRTFQLNIFEQNPATVIAVIQQPQQLLRRRLARLRPDRIHSFPAGVPANPDRKSGTRHTPPPKTDEAYRC